jgi:transposase
VKKITTAHASGNENFKEHHLTIGLDLGDRASYYCILDDAGEVILEHKLPTTAQAILLARG